MKVTEEVYAAFEVMLAAAEDQHETALINNFGQRLIESRGICPVCGKEFHLTRLGKIYCSAKCKDVAHHRKKRGYSVGDQERICKFCGKTFTATNLAKKFCSDKCRIDFYARRYCQRKKSLKQS